MSETLTSIPRVRLYEAIIRTLERLITEGHYRPGDRLPSEREMARAFKVSRTAVREAMSVLESAGLVDVRPGLGIFVREGTESAFRRRMATMLLSERNSLLDLLEVRSILEAEGASMAAIAASPEDLEEIRAAYEALSRAVAEGRLGTEEDYAFHYAVAKASGNMVLVKVMNAIADVYQDGLARRRSRALEVPGRPAKVLMEHRRIVEAIERRDPDGARRAMKQHVGAVRARLLEEVGGRGEDGADRCGESGKRVEEQPGLRL